MRFGAQDRLFVLSGAGISAESGLATFRGSGGLWNGHRVEEVATPEAWEANPELVWRFYSMRRRDAMDTQPNAAHNALAAIEEQMGDRFYLCTQNVDDLHERAGSHRLHHMHGELFQSRCVSCDNPFEDRRFYEPAPRSPCAKAAANLFARTSCGSARSRWIWRESIANSIARQFCLSSAHRARSILLQV